MFAPATEPCPNSGIAPNSTLLRCNFVSSSTTSSKAYLTQSTGEMSAATTYVFAVQKK